MMLSVYICAFILGMAMLLHPSVYDINILSPHSQSVSVHTRPISSVLVLGSGGLVGTALTEWLYAHGYEVIHVRNRTHIDLREPGALNVFKDTRIEFAFFLACEVGGSKFLNQAEAQLNIIQHNVAMYQNVFPWLKQRNIPFIFTSSYLQFQSTPYGAVKRLGEMWISSMGWGRIGRLWNVYGAERVGVRSHVIPDWVNACIQHQHIHSRTNGEEMRQFLHADDCASALGTMMLKYDELPQVTDVSSGHWNTMKEVASMVINASNIECSVTFGEHDARFRERVPPRMDTVLYETWEPRVHLEQGISDLFDHYDAETKCFNVTIDETFGNGQ